MKYEIRNTYEVSQTQEFSVDYNGLNYLVIYGKHINGGFIAIPNWGISVEASVPTDIFYNTERLASEFEDYEIPKVIAEAIKEHWESIEKAVPNAEKLTAEPEISGGQTEETQNPHRAVPLHEREER